MTELVRKREALRAELDAHLAACVSRGPHGYITCQIVYDRLQERLDRIEARLRSAAQTDVLGPAADR